MKTKKIIWNDNIFTDNYEMSFENEDGVIPDKISLINRDDDKNNATEKWVYDFVSQQYVDNANSVQDNRLTNIENTNITQDIRLSTIENLDVVQNDRLANVENVNNDQNNRLDNLESTTNTHTQQLSDILGIDGQQNGRLDNIENDIEVNKTDIENIENDILTDVCKVCERKKNYNIFVNEDGIYNISGNVKFLESDGTDTLLPVSGLLVRKTENGGSKIISNMQQVGAVQDKFADITATIINNSLNLSLMTTRELKNKFSDLELHDVVYTKCLDSANANTMIKSIFDQSNIDVTIKESALTLSNMLISKQGVTNNSFYGLIQKNQIFNDLNVDGVTFTEPIHVSNVGGFTRIIFSVDVVFSKILNLRNNIAKLINGFENMFTFKAVGHTAIDNIEYNVKDEYVPIVTFQVTNSDTVEMMFYKSAYAPKQFSPEFHATYTVELITNVLGV